MPGRAVPSKNLHLRRGILPAGSWKPAPDSGVCRREQGALRSYPGLMEPGAALGRLENIEWIYNGPKALIVYLWSERCGLTSLQASPLFPDCLLLMLGLLHQRLRQGPGRGCKEAGRGALIPGEQRSKLSLELDCRLLL